MKRDEIIRMAMESGMTVTGSTSGIFDNSLASGKIESLIRFANQVANLVAAAEREECAKVCQDAVDSGMYDGRQQYAAAACRDAIRDMNKQEQNK